MKLVAFSIFLTCALSAQTLRVETIANPAPANSLQGHWGTAPDGSLLLSWIEPVKEGSYNLRYAVRKNGQWSAAQTIVQDRHFFRQPAEAPSVVALSGGSYVAEWVEVPQASSEAENIYVSASKDGVKWSAPVMAHKDKSPVQHALVSMTVSGPNEVSLIWLEALKGEDFPSTLKRTMVNGDGAVLKEEIVNPDVCTCCPTSVVKTEKGLLVAYRGHTKQNIRDINISRFEAGKWQAAKVLNADKWEIDACPVNGAAAAAQGNKVAVAWYTESQDKPRTQVMFSADGGAVFGKPTMVSTDYSYGYPSIAMDADGGAIVSWLQEGKGDFNVVLVRKISAAGVAGPVTQVMQGERSVIGYPQLTRVGNETWIAWGAGKAKVQTARIQ